MTHTGKMYERNLEERLRTVIEEKLKDGRYGFRPERRTTDPIFTEDDNGYELRMG